MVANELNNVYPVKIWIYIFTIFVFIFYSSFCHANTYRWEDITEPFNSEFELIEGQNVIVEIWIPEVVLKSLGKIPILINHSTNHSLINYPSVQINNSIWATYNLSNTKLLDIKKKHLNPGINKFNFYLNGDNSDRGDSAVISIKEIRFDFADKEFLKKQLSERKNLKLRTEVSVGNKTKKKSDINNFEGHRQKQNILKKVNYQKHTYDKHTRKYLQHALTFLGYYHGTVDGVFRQKTRLAIKAYQKKHGEEPTGHFDKKTVNKLVQIGKEALNNTGPKNISKSKFRKKPLKVQKNVSDYRGQKKMDPLFLSIKNKIEENQKEKAREIEKKTKLIQEVKNQDRGIEEVATKRNVGILKTPEELAKRYQSLIDRFNKSMNESFYNQMLSSIQSCYKTGYYVSGAFFCHYLYMRSNELASRAQTKLEAHRNSRLAEGFKNARNQLIMHYNSSTENKQALTEVLNKCENYYQTTKERPVHRKN